MELKASVIGSKVKAILDLNPAIRIKGITSRGAFLEANGDWVLFLTREEYRGPLTMNVPDFDHQGIGLAVNHLIEVRDQRMLFPNSRQVISFAAAEIWRPEPMIGLPEAVQARAIRNVRKISDPLTRVLLGLEIGSALGDDDLLNSITSLSDFVRKRDFNKAFQEAKHIIGRGAGLTPEGDDFMIGLLFTLRVGIKSRDIPGELEEFLGGISKLAAERTTRLSANLISCAAEGLADERISEVVRALYQEPGEVGEKVSDLLKWGNTSGRMALGGIVCGIIAIQRDNDAHVV